MAVAISDSRVLRRLLTALIAAAPRPASTGWAVASQSEMPRPSAYVDEAVQRRVADAAPRPVRDPPQADGVERVVDHLQVRHDVLDLGALVEARAADHLVGDALAHEHVLEHAALGVRAVDDPDLGEAVAALEQRGDLGRDEPRLGVLVLGLDHVHRLALAEVRPQVLLLAGRGCAR